MTHRREIYYLHFRIVRGHVKFTVFSQEIFIRCLQNRFACSDAIYAKAVHANRRSVDVSAECTCSNFARTRITSLYFFQLFNNNNSSSTVFEIKIRLPVLYILTQRFTGEWNFRAEKM